MLKYTIDKIFCLIILIDYLTSLVVYADINWILAFDLFVLLALFHYIDQDLMGFFINPFIINKVVNGKNI